MIVTYISMCYFKTEIIRTAVLTIGTSHNHVTARSEYLWCKILFNVIYFYIF